MRAFSTCLLLLFLFSACNLLAQRGDLLFNPAQLHEIRLHFWQDDFWELLETNYEDSIDDSGVDVPYLPAAMIIDGFALDTIGVRFKGLSSFGWSGEFKKGFKIDLNEFSQGQSYDGIKKFNLHNGACDPGLLRDFVCYDVLRTAGVKAPRVSHGKLFINDQYWGLYSIIEQVDKSFVNMNFADGDGDLVKNIGWSELKWAGDSIQPYLVDFQWKTNEDSANHPAFLHLLDVINNAPDSTFAQQIQAVFNVDLFLHVLAVDLMTDNWDSYVDNERNWYLYLEPNSQKWQWIPWDYNLALGGDFNFEGNPYPPFDPTCLIQADFRTIQNGSSFVFLDKTQPEAQTWHWDYGDGTSSSDQTATHTYAADSGSVTVCLTATLQNGSSICEQTRCQKINLGFNPGMCQTIQSGSCPYSPLDPVFQQVVASDEFCCEDEWDVFCEIAYFEIAQGNANDTIGNPGVPYGYDFPLLLDNDNKILVKRLLDVPEFYQRYLDIACIILQTNFRAERLFPLIDQQANLIREAIHDDPNYFFSHDYFEYDVGNGTGGGGDAGIPSLKWVLLKRFGEMLDDLTDLQHNCLDAFSPIGWHDVVINEIVAANTVGSTDPAGEHDDWIELFNPGSDPVDLSYFYLTDEYRTPLQWKFPAGTTIEAGGYLIVWADKNDLQPGLHANFRLSKSGEAMMLMHEDGTVIDSVTFGTQADNLAYARVPNGEGDFMHQTPTFSASNNLPSSAGEPMAAQLFKVFPNPASEVLTLEFSPPQLGDRREAVLRNLLGTIVWSETNLAGRQVKIDVSTLEPGVYFLEGRSGEQRQATKILIF